MLHEYQLTNFKAFAGPETIPIKPITLIYGPNSSGKSSVLQSLLLLKQTLEEAESTETLLHPQGSFVNLGSYCEFVHRHNISQPFSFKVFLKIEQLEPLISIGSLLAEQLNETPFLGLRIVFTYDEDTSTVIFSAIELFIGDEPYPAAIYKPEGGAGSVVQLDQIDPKHRFWKAWYKKFQQSIQKDFKKLVRSFLEQVKESFPQAVVETIIAKTGKNKLATALQKAHEYLKAQQIQMEAEAQEPEPELLDKLDEIDFLMRLWQRFDKYSLEKAIEDFSKVVQYSSSVSHRNFLPIDLDKISLEEPAPKIDYLSRVYGGFGTAEYLWELTEPVCSLLQEFLERIVYIGPLRNYPERFYIFSGSSSEQVGQSGKMIPDLLRKHPALLKRVNQQIEKFELEYELKITKFVDQETEERIDELSEIFALRLVNKRTNVKVSLLDVGFGISQVLPIIVQSMFSEGKTLLIEQPELHLHPKLQAELGDIFIESALGKQKNTFILETHSEHLLLRIMRRMRETFNGDLPQDLPRVRPEDISVLFVEPAEESSVVREMPLNERGELVKAWPGGFFEEELDEIF